MKPLEPLTLPLSGTQLIEASAGTGKTHTLTTLYLRLLIERRLPPSRILVVTFTNAATAELKDRIRARMRTAISAFEGTGTDPELTALAAASSDRSRDAQLLRSALRSLDEAAVFTIHGFCQRVLAEHAFESGVPFAQELSADPFPILLELVQDFWARELCQARHAEVRFLASRGGFGGLISLARVASSFADTPVVPAPDERAVLDVPGLSQAIDDYLLARARASELWRAQAAEIEACLRAARLKATSHTPERLAESLSAVAALMARTEPSLDGWSDVCERLTSARLANATLKGHAPPAHAFFARMQTLLVAHQAATEALGRWQLALEQRLVAFVRRELPLRKAERRVLSFDDLLGQLCRALRSPLGDELSARLSEQYAAVLVDEFQDTDPVQYEIFHRAFGARGGTLFLIGDPKQAIYAFRGADVFAYMRAARDAGGSGWTLATNYRSDPSLVCAVNTLFGRLERPFLLPDIGYHAVRARPDAKDALELADGGKSAFEIAFIPRKLAGREVPMSKNFGEAEIPGWVAAHISELLASGATLSGRRVQPGDIAVLTRTNGQARDVQLELRALSIPSVMRGDSSVLDAPEARELALVLAALAEPGAPLRVRTALATALLGLSASEVERLQHDEAAWEGWMDGFARWSALWARQGFVQAFRRLMRDTNMASRLLELIDGDRRLTNVLHLVELLHQEAARRQLGIAGLLQWFCDVRFDKQKREVIAAEIQQLRLERDDAAVQLMTMHGSKGLEWPIVYCPYLWTNGGLFDGDKRLLRYHDPEHDHRFKLDLRPIQDKQHEIELAEIEARSESLRLAYVALTRARHRTVAYWGVFRQTSAPLAHLLHPPERDPRAPAQKLNALDDRRIVQELQTLAELSEHAIEVRELRPTPGIPLDSAARALEHASAKSFGRRLTRSWQGASFSALAKSDVELSVPARVGRDVDEHSALPGSELDASERQLPEQQISLHAFPRGARAGDLIHQVLEHLHFAADRAEIDAVVASCLDRHGFDPELGSTLADAISEILRTPLLDAGTRLCDVDPGRRISELEFVFPVGRTASRRIAAADIASLIDRHREPEIPADYPARVARLGFEPLAGFMRGFVDLVFEHDGRFWVVDYKSNHLGPRPDDYTGESIAHAMTHHHYHLQYLLYSVALHRHLGARQPGYDFERNFGGVLYLFLRGMHPRSGHRRGVFRSRPSRALVTALSDLFGGVRS